MDKTWIKAPLTSETYKIGAQSFINFAEAKAVRGEIVCPCLKCCNRKWFNIDLVHRHILSKGFLRGYTIWTFHGEQRLNPNPQANQRENGSYIYKDSKELMENVNELIKQKTNELGISGPLDPKLQSEIHNEVWKELMEDDNSRKPIGYDVGVPKTRLNKLSDDLRRIMNDDSGSNEIHALQKIVSVQENQIRDIIHYLVSQIKNPKAPSEMYSNVNMDPTLLANIGLSQSQGRVVDHVSNNNEATISSLHIPSP